MATSPTLFRTAQFAAIAAIMMMAQTAVAQNYERYRPHTVTPRPAPRSVPKEELPTLDGSDRVLVDRLDAVIVLDSQDKVDPDNAFEDSEGIEFNFDASGSLVRSAGFRRIVERYLGGEVTLRNLNQMSRDLILYYRDRGQPVVDIFVPEQRITAGTVQIVVLESRVGRVVVEDGCYFDGCDLTKWISCTRRGSRIYESAIANDLFWLNQNGFRRVDVDLRPGALQGTTDVFFEVDDVRPWNAYAGYEDTGVPTLGLERLYAGLIWGNAFGRDATLSYQYTTDDDFRRLHAHAISYLEPINRCWSFQTYGSWARVDPSVLVGVTQSGESWQAGLGFFRHLTKNRYEDTSLSFGFDFKSTNNNLEFGGVRVSASTADLIQLRFGWQTLRRYGCGEYLTLSSDTYVGPGSGFTSNSNSAAFNTIRSGTSTDYIYSRSRFERLWKLPRKWEFVTRAVGQTSSERLLFSETLGFGGYDSIRGYDQRAFSGDHGWIVNFELGPATRRFCVRGQNSSLRTYALLDLGKAYIEDELPGEPEDE
ncbi:MAG: ShlB/FhaC/HecB family hemolysin secretion/activation protein, partial [Pirellulales bacterium]|nr:ShlB/FhaC/HecB family hemolysin secretion/activation protein [Pirellulales bacterium]